MSQTFVKDPDAILDFSVNWAEWLDDDTISTSAWDAADGITVEASPAPSHADGIATVWLSGGTHGVNYPVTNHIVTSAGREDDRTLTIKVCSR